MQSTEPSIKVSKRNRLCQNGAGLVFYIFFLLMNCGSVKGSEAPSHVSSCSDGSTQSDVRRGHTSEEQGQSGFDAVRGTVCVFTPPGYDETSIRYPIIYALDGNYTLPLLRLVQRDLGYPFIIVGVELVDRESLIGLDSNRALYDFLVKELIPFIEKKYRADGNERAIFGHSYAGRFVGLLPGLDSRRHMYRYYISSDGSFGTYPGDWKSLLANNLNDLTGKLFVVGAFNGNGPLVKRFIDEVARLSPPRLEVAYQDLPAGTHDTAAESAARLALQAIFNTAQTSPKALRMTIDSQRSTSFRYVGSGLYFGEIELQKGHHIIQFDGNATINIPNISVDVAVPGGYVARVNAYASGKAKFSISSRLSPFDAYTTFLKGSFNNWESTVRLNSVANNIWVAHLQLPRGLHELKVMSWDSVSVDFGFDNVLSIQPLKISLKRHGQSVQFFSGKESAYSITLDATDYDAPELTVESEDNEK